METELWSKVKAGDWVIYADEYEGVHKAKVTETDIKVLEEGPPAAYTYPWGLTKDAGTVRIQWNSHLEIMNLADLITYSPSKLMALEKAFKKLQAARDQVEDERETFLGLVQEYRE